MVDVDKLRARAHKNDASWHDVVQLCDLVDELRGDPDAETLRLLSEHELDLHFHSSREKVSVWHGASLTRVTAFYSDHGGATGALAFAVRRCVEEKLQGAENGQA